jgi:uracil-DNA glycosylase
MTLDELNTQIKTCKKCRLHENTKNAVPGEGPINAKIMFVGQNPGAEEDAAGRPFVGRAGKFLNKTLQKFGLTREDVFITNLVKHTSPKNRAPLPDEIAACQPYIVEQIQIIKPKIVVLMGATAWKTPKLNGVNYMQIYHPSAAMRFTKIRIKFEADIQKIAQQTKQL